MKKLNASGFAHFAALAFIVLGIAVFGTYSLVASHANALKTGTPSFTTKSGVRLAGQTGAYSSEVTVKPGDSVEFSIELYNQSTSIVKTVRVHDSLPSGLSAVNSSLALDGAPVNALIANYTVGDLAVGQFKRVTFLATVSSKANACGTKGLTNRVTVNALKLPAQSSKMVVHACPDSSSTSTQAKLKKEGLSVTLGVRPEGAGAFTKDTSVLPGSNAQFAITVVNKGATTIKNVRIHNTLPGGMVAGGGSLKLDDATVSGVLSNFPLGDLQPGEDKALTFTALISPKVKACGTKTLADQVTVTGTSWPTQRDSVVIHSCSQ